MMCFLQFVDTLFVNLLVIRLMPRSVKCVKLMNILLFSLLATALLFYISKPQNMFLKLFWIIYMKYQCYSHLITILIPIILEMLNRYPVGFLTEPPRLIRDFFMYMVLLCTRCYCKAYLNEMPCYTFTFGRMGALSFLLVQICNLYLLVWLSVRVL